MIKTSSLSLYEESKYYFNDVKNDLHLNELSKFNKFRIKFFWSAYWKKRIFNLYGFYKEEVAVHINELVYGVFTSREKAQRAIRKYVDNEEEGINENSFFINQRELDED